MFDPRRRFRTVDRDLEAARFIGVCREVTSYQLQAAVFGEVSRAALGRFTRRWLARRLIAVDRWNGIGINRFRLTPAGREALVRSGAAQESELFVSKKLVAAKDVEHHLWTVDVGVVARTLDPPPDLVSFFWAIERAVKPRPEAIPDVLADRSARPGTPGYRFAFEVDLGTESLRRQFLPKLERLATLLVAAEGDVTSAIVVLTTSSRRTASITKAMRGRTGSVPLFVAELPEVTGAKGLADLGNLLRPGRSSMEQIAESKSCEVSDLAACELPDTPTK